MRTPTLLIALLLVAAPASAAERIFEISGARPQRAVVTRTPDAPPDPLPRAAMLRSFVGVVALVEDPQGLNRLRNAAPPVARPVPIPEDASAWRTVHLFVEEASKRIEILRTPRGRYFAREVGGVDATGGAPLSAPITPRAFEPFVAAWAAFEGDFNKPPLPAAQMVELSRPYPPGAVALNGATIRDRIGATRTTRYPATRRDLDRETLHLRLPRGYDPGAPAGLVVWISPTPQGRPPRSLHKALDELNLVCVGADASGNERMITDRLQLAFDGLSAASKVAHVDPRRVYTVGMSGGAKCAAILWGCFPDVFAGSVPIVGLGAYEEIPTGKGRERWPALFKKPKPDRFELLQTRPLAPMTGPPDFNYKNIVAYTRQLTDDGMAVRLFEYADMAHTMPTPDRFLEAVRWVDAPHQFTRGNEVAEAHKLLKEHKAAHGDRPPMTDGQRSALERVCETAPWSPPAMEAARLLGFFK